MGKLRRLVASCSSADQSSSESDLFFRRSNEEKKLIIKLGVQNEGEVNKFRVSASPPDSLPLLESGLMNDKVHLEDNSVCSESIAARWIAPAV